MYHVDCRGRSKVIVVVRVVVCDEGCKLGAVVSIKDGDRVK